MTGFMVILEIDPPYLVTLLCTGDICGHHVHSLGIDPLPPPPAPLSPPRPAYTTSEPLATPEPLVTTPEHPGACDAAKLQPRRSHLDPHLTRWRQTRIVTRLLTRSIPPIPLVTSEP